MQATFITMICLAAATAGGAERNNTESTVELPTLSERRPPLRELNVEQTLRVTDFGAKPNDSQNDLPAVRKVVEMVRQSGTPTRIVFDPGKYIFDADVDNDMIAQALKTSIALYKMQNVILDGNGAEITIRKPRLGFVNVLACTNVIVKNFTVDWDPAPFAQGFIRGVDTEKGTFTFEPQAGYLSLDHPNWQRAAVQRIGPGRWGVIMDRNVPGRLKNNALNVVMYKGWEKNDDGTYRIAVKYRGVLKDMDPGDRYVQVDRNGAGLVLFRKNQRVTCMNHTMQTSDAAVIAIVLKRLGGKLAEWRALDRILIEANTIVDWRRRGIFLACAENVTIRNNRLLTKAAPPAFRDLPLIPIQLANVRNVEVTENLVRDTRNITSPIVMQEPPCDGVRVQSNVVQP